MKNNFAFDIFGSWAGALVLVPEPDLDREWGLPPKQLYHHEIGSTFI